MRIDTKKFLFAGLETEKDLFFKKAQEIGLIQFVDMRPKGSFEISPEVDKIVHAIKILRGLAPVDQEETEEFALADGIAAKLVSLKEALDKKREDLRITTLEMARVAIFGAFSIDDIKEIEREGNRKIQFFCSKPHLTDIPENAIFIGSEGPLSYFVAINKERVTYENMIEMHIDQPIDVLKKKKEHIIEEIHEIESRIKSYAKYNQFLHKALACKLDDFHLKSSKHYAKTEMDDDLFFVSGWVPVSKVDDVHHLISEMHLFAEEIAAEPEEIAPTCLENKGASRIGEDLVHIYDTPSNTDKDPSLWVLIWFALFFSMIIGDAGYGLIFLGAALYIRYKFGESMKGAGLRVWKLVCILGAASVIWGLMINSFFGIQFAPGHFFRDHSVLTWMVREKASYYMETENKVYTDLIAKNPELKNIKDPGELLEKAVREHQGAVSHEFADSLANGILMEISLMIGVIHILFSLGRYAGRNYSSTGWMIAIIGGVLYIPVYLDSPGMLNYIFHVSFTDAQYEGTLLMSVGFVLATVASFFQHKIKGVLEPLTIIQIFADIMSYLRIYALGLAGGIVSATINEFAGTMSFVFSVLLLLIGHTINIALSIMGGVIHGLRLNFLEWYHYCFEGGGKQYNPLRKLADKS